MNLKRIVFTCASCLPLLLLTRPAAAQVFSAGVKGGTPLSDAGITTPGTVGPLGASGTSSGPSTLNVRRYTIGPTVEFALPFRLRFEADFLYKRLDQTSRSSSRGVVTITRLVANSWEFPLAVKYVWQYGSVRPFALTGGSVRRINSFEGSQEQFAPGTSTPYTLTQYRFEGGRGLTQGGWVIGSGVRFDVSVVKISPEIRYTRWTSERLFPTQNQVEFLLGMMF